jgi:hypothetical protein
MPVTGGISELACRQGAWAARFVVTALGCLILAGCSESTPAPAPPGESSPTSAGSATYSVQLCSEAAEYQTAANATVTLDASTAGVDGVKLALEDLQTSTNNLIATAAAENQFGPQVAELEKAGASLDATVAGLSGQDSLPANLGEVAASVGAVQEAAKPIVDSLRPGCPSVPPAEIPPTS